MISPRSPERIKSPKYEWEQPTQALVMMGICPPRIFASPNSSYHLKTPSWFCVVRYIRIAGMAAPKAGQPENRQEFLRRAWKDAPDGYLSPYQQMRVCVLHEVLKEIGNQIPYGLRDGKPNYQWIADRVVLNG